MSYRHLVWTVAVVVGVACKPAPEQVARPAAVPKIRATVVTLRTTIQPANRTFEHLVVIRGDLARSTAEHDTWRLFDTKAKTVTFVDEVERVIRTQPLPEVLRGRRTHSAAALPSHIRPAGLIRTDEREAILGLPAQKWVIESGAYRRELWLAEHPSIPPGLFAMMHASEPPSSQLAPMMRAVDEALMNARGFPLLDHTEVTYDNTKMIVDRVVISVVQRDVAEGLIEIPAGYETEPQRPTASDRTRTSGR